MIFNILRLQQSTHFVRGERAISTTEVAVIEGGRGSTQIVATAKIDA
ncbi:unannotated protein [freshwater metagenome]|uniref:Unannotated protein n=1 Tax=freshwater metagenome TaxID=449393 RepID=A0A6J7E6M1_9ZZZZ